MAGDKSFREKVREEALNFLRNHGELSKVDFKLKPPKLHKLAQEVAAIANTDDPNASYYKNSELRDHGFLIIGVEGGEIKGYDDWDKQGEDGFGCGDARGQKEPEERIKDCLNAKLKEYVSPLPEFSLFRFEAEGKPFWVILIYPSARQPHLVVKDGNGLERFTIYVRKGSQIERASVEDYARFLHNAVVRAVQPLQSELDSLKRRLDALEGSYNQLTQHLMWKGLEASGSSLSRGAQKSHSEGEPPPNLRSLVSLEEAARSLRLSRQDPIAEALYREVSALRNWLAHLPWDLPGDLEGWKKLLAEMEEATMPFLRGLGELVAGDDGEGYAPKVKEALELLGKAGIPPLTLTSWAVAAEAVHLYPLLLAVYHLGILAHFHRRPAYLRLLLDLSFWVRSDSLTRPVFPRLRDVFYNYTHPYFEALYPNRCDPLSWHLYQILFVRPAPTWAHLPEAVKTEALNYASRGDLNGTLALYLEGEFVLGLLALKHQLDENGQEVRPLYGLYAFGMGAASQRISLLVTRPPQHLCQVLGLSGQSLETYLSTLGAKLLPTARCISSAYFYQDLAKKAASGQLGRCPEL